MRSARSSRNGGAAIWMPSGRPLKPKPAGTATVGSPVMLNENVQRAATSYQKYSVSPTWHIMSASFGA